MYWTVFVSLILAVILQGPSAACYWLIWGLKVIRIEKIDGSEDRYTIPVGEGADGETSVGAMFLQMNRNQTWVNAESNETRGP